MFRFSIRELMLLTLVTGLVMGWGLDHLKLSQALTEAVKWRTSAGALERHLGDLGWKARWDFENEQVHLDNDGVYSRVMTRIGFEPSSELGEHNSN
jgi:hypothetical protein